ncbi:MAG: porin family protein [Flavobacteriales bacterium]|nr:porin family protein [Flavobacteriales bacterium]
MKNILHFTTLFALALFSYMNSFAQQYRGPSLAFGVQVVQPVGEFAKQFDGYPAGVSGTFSAPIGRSPFELGFGYAWNNMGSQNKDISALVYTDSLGYDIYEPGTMRIRSTINRYQVIARFRPFNGRIQPYVDAMSGVEAYKTKTDITLDNSGYSEASNSVRQHLDMTYSFGWAAGLRIAIADNIFIEGRFENLTGGTANYVDKDSIELQDNNDITFETKESATSKYTYQMGLAFRF